MKKIIFVRHGRAEDQSPEITDFERSLTIKGKVIARQMAKIFVLTEKNPGLYISSPAFRALETALVFAGVAELKPEKIKIDSNLYYRASLNHVLDLIRDTDEKVNSVTLFGHNPAFTEIPDRLSANGCEFVTKTSIVCISFDVRLWNEVKPGNGKIEYFLKPEKQI